MRLIDICEGIRRTHGAIRSVGIAPPSEDRVCEVTVRVRAGYAAEVEKVLTAEQSHFRPAGTKLQYRVTE